MVHILHDLPYFNVVSEAKFEAHTETSIDVYNISVKPYQIIVWVSLTKPLLNADEFLALNPPSPRFPALLDTGLSHNFLIREEHLRDWVKKTLSDFPPLRPGKFNGVDVPLYEADIWIHHNRPGARDDFLDVPPFHVEPEDGIGVYPTATASLQNLPILGLRAIDFARLHLAVNADDRLVSLSIGSHV